MLLRSGTISGMCICQVILSGCSIRVCGCNGNSMIRPAAALVEEHSVRSQPLTNAFGAGHCRATTAAQSSETHSAPRHHTTKFIIYHRIVVGVSKSVQGMFGPALS